MYLLIASVLIRVMALAWAVALMRRVRDARLLFKGVVIALFAASASMPVLYAIDHGTGAHGASHHDHDTAHLVLELGNFITSVLLLLGVVLVSRVFDHRARYHAGLRASEERYRRLVEQCVDAVLVHSRGRFVFANAAAARLLGAPSAASLIGLPVIDRVHPDFRDLVRSRIETLKAGGAAVAPPQEERLLRLDGSVIDAEITGSACSFEGESAVQVVVRDVSARKRAEQDLLESRAVLEKAQAVAHVGSWVWTPGRAPELAWSAETFRIFGLDPAAFDGRLESFLRCVHPDDTAAVHAASESARAENRPYSVDHRIIRPDGQVRWVHEEGEVVPAPGSDGFAMIGVVQDITERRAAQEALAESERRYRQLFKLSPQPMWVYDAQTRRFLAVNEAAVAHYGYSRDEFLRMTTDDLRAAGEAAPAPVNGEAGPARHRRRDGGVIDVETVAQSVPFIGPGARLVVARDVSEQRRAERLRAGQRRVLELLARGAPLEEVLGQLAAAYEAQIEGARCSIHLLEQDGAALRTAVAPSLPAPFIAETDGAAVGPDAGPCGVAAHLRERITIPDLRTARLDEGWRRRLERLGLRACWSQPIVGTGGSVLGTLALHFGTVREPSGRELELLESAASLAGVAIERRRGEAALQEANDRLKAIIWSSPLPIIAIDRDGLVRLWNAAATATFGWTEDEALGRPNPIVPEEKQAEFRGLVRRIVEGESIYNLELRRRRRDGTLIDVSLSASQLHSSSGEVTGVLAVVADITERKRTEAALRESETDRKRAQGAALEWQNRYETAVRASRQVVYEWDPATNRVVWGGNPEEMLGVSGEPLESLDQWLDLVHPDDQPLLRAEIDRLITTRAPFTFQHRVRRRDGQYIEVEDTASHYIDAGGAGRMIGLVSDITQRKRLESDLRQTQKLDAIGRLASGVAHDFNNLLTAIFGYTSLARRTLSPTHPATRSLDRVDEAARQASGVTKALLTFSRARPTEKLPLNLVRAVEQSIDLLRRTLPATIDIRPELERGPVWVRGDATQLQQVVMNLAINARDAMPRGGTLRIRLQSVEPDRAAPTARLTVSDTGTGIAPEVLARIFEPFFTTKPPGQGTGLGLPIIHGIVTDHGGRIDIQSEPGKGATFVIDLPLAAPAPAGRGPVPVREAAGRGELIILGDRHTYVREIVATMLQGMGFRVVQASDGEAALALYRKHRDRLRLLILDEDLPSLSAWACIEAIRGHGGTIPAVVMAAAEPPAALPDRTIVLRKPFQMGELSGALAGVLAESPTATEPA